MLENVIGKRYAVALSGSIKDDFKLQPALEHLRSLVQAFEVEPSLTSFFAHPSIPMDKKEALLSKLCDRFKVDDGVRNLVKMLNERKKVLFLENIADYFESVVDNRLNQVRVRVLSACPLEKKQSQKLESSLQRILNKNILIETEVNESLIGGLALEVGSVVVDATIKNRLAQLKRSIEQEEVG